MIYDVQILKPREAEAGIQFIYLFVFPIVMAIQVINYVGDPSFIFTTKLMLFNIKYNLFYFFFACIFIYLVLCSTVVVTRFLRSKRMKGFFVFVESSSGTSNSRL